jgi:hypothetical protein
MPVSQNVTFTGEAPRDDAWGHLTGASVAALVRLGLQERGWKVAAIEKWRDCGWAFDSSRDESKLQVGLMRLEPDLWFLQIAAAYRPSFVDRLFGRTATAGPCDVLDLARDVHAVISSGMGFADFKWCWDGFPETEELATSEPLSPR